VTRVRRLTLRPGVVGRPWDNGWWDGQLTDCFHQLMRALNAFADFVRTTSLACVHEKMGRSLPKFVVRPNGMLTERDLRHEVVQCNHRNCSQFRSARF
jgi:hypothetical protein